MAGVPALGLLESDDDMASSCRERIPLSADVAIATWASIVGPIMRSKFTIDTNALSVGSAAFVVFFL
jgi:hypothetical protein